MSDPLGKDAPNPLFYGLASVVFFAYHTAGYLPTVVAIDEGHPGLKAIGFPHPNRNGVWCAHPLASCRIGDDPATSALDDNHELRGHPGIFVTDASSVPTSLCVNPSLTIAALAERASSILLRRAAEYGVAVKPVPQP